MEMFATSSVGRFRFYQVDAVGYLNKEEYAERLAKSAPEVGELFVEDDQLLPVR